MEFIIPEEETELIIGKVKVEWVNLGEGLSGDYNPDDPEDENLLRFDVSKLENGEWVEVPDASYCTLFSANASDENKQEGLRILMDNIYEEVRAGHSIKKLCERLSWISPETMENF